MMNHKAHDMEHIIKHKFESHNIDPQTKVLIIGTFNPDIPENTADYFYSRPKNHLWTLLSVAYGFENLKAKSKKEKQQFISSRKIGFIDIIAEVRVTKLTNYQDQYIDDKVEKWTDVISEIKKLGNLKHVCFTRKTLSGIPHIKTKIRCIEKYCIDNGIHFQYLITPARIYSEDKQREWTDFFASGL